MRISSKSHISLERRANLLTPPKKIKNKKINKQNKNIENKKTIVSSFIKAILPNSKKTDLLFSWKGLGGNGAGAHKLKQQSGPVTGQVRAALDRVKHGANLTGTEKSATITTAVTTTAAATTTTTITTTTTSHLIFSIQREVQGKLLVSPPSTIFVANSYKGRLFRKRGLNPVKQVRKYEC